MILVDHIFKMYKFQDEVNFVQPVKASRLSRGHRYEMDSLAFEKFQNAVFFKIFKFPFNR